MSIKSTLIVKGAVKATKVIGGGLMTAATIWAVGYFLGMGQRDGEKASDMTDELIDRAVSKHYYRKVLKDFIKKNQLRKGEAKELFNRLFTTNRRAKNECWSDEEFNDEINAVLGDYQKPDIVASESEGKEENQE